MAKQKQSEEDFLRDCREKFERAESFDRDNRLMAEDDLHFIAPTDYAGHWPRKIKEERERQGRPVLTINRMPQFVMQVANDMRINRTAIKVAPVDDGSDPKLAEVMAGIIRNIERNSDAIHVYSEAGTSAASCGMGHFRICLEYASDDTFDRDIRIRGISNPFAVLWDPGAVEYTREDAQWCFVYQEIPLEDFQAEYPDAKDEDFGWGDTLTNTLQAKGWYTGNTVRIAEFWERKTEKATICQLPTGEIVDEDDVPEGVEPTETRVVDRPYVTCTKISGAAILEKAKRWNIRHIPIISVWGRETHIGRRVIRSSVIRYAKDAQRLYNYHRSAEVELVALQPKAPFVGTRKMFEGHERAWRTANVTNAPYLPYTPDPAAPGGRPERQQPPQPSSALLQEIKAAADDMHGTTGIYPPSLGARSNETSGIAIRAREKQGDVGTFDFIDNLSRSIGHCGRILIDLIPQTYDTTRIIRMLGEDDSHSFVRLNQPNPLKAMGGPLSDQDYVTILRDEKGHTTFLPDLSAGKYDIAVSTGPSYSTKRAEAADSMLQFMQTNPQASVAIADLIAKNQDWPGSEEIAKRLRRLAVRAGVADPAEDDPPPEPPPPPPPDPKLIADAQRATADAAYKAEQTKGLALDNAVKELQLGQQIGELQATIQSLQGMMAHLLGPPPGPPPGMPPQPSPIQPAPDPGGGLFFDPSQQQPQPLMATPPMAGVIPGDQQP